MINPSHLIIFILLLLTAGVTAFYMFRVIFMTFTGAPRVEKRYAHAHESPKVMAIPLILLAVLALGSGWPPGWFGKLVVKPDLAAYRTVEVMPAGDDHAAHYQTTEATNEASHADLHEQMSAATHGEAAHGERELADHTVGGAAMHGESAHEGHGDHAHHEHIAHQAHVMAMWMSIAAALLGIFLAWLFYGRKRFSAEAVRRSLPWLHTLLTKKYYFDELYWNGVIMPARHLAQGCRIFDNKVIDGAVNGSAWLTAGFSWVIGIFDNKVIDGIVNGIAWITIGLGRQFRKIQTGKIQNYLFGAALVALILIFVRLFRGF
jgi:NADH-quinone oxidoreductase subunit L